MPLYLVEVQENKESAVSNANNLFIKAFVVNVRDILKIAIREMVNFLSLLFIRIQYML